LCLVHPWLYFILFVVFTRVLTCFNTEHHGGSISPFTLSCMASLNTPCGRSGHSIKFTNWNVKRLNHPIKSSKVLAHLKFLKSDIAFITETHIQGSGCIALKRGWVGQVYHSSFQGRARWACILISKSVQFISSETRSDPYGRFVIVMGKLYDLPVTLAGVYAPTCDDSKFMNNFLSTIPYLDTHQLILAGDCNCVINPLLDRSSSSSLNPKQQNA